MSPTLTVKLCAVVVMFMCGLKSILPHVHFGVLVVWILQRFDFKTVESVMFSTNIIISSNDKCDSFAKSIQEPRERRLQFEKTIERETEPKRPNNEKSNWQDTEPETGPG